MFLASRRVEWRDTADTLLKANWVLVGLGVIALIATFVAFAFRWQVLLSSTIKVPVQSTFTYIMIGYLANTVLPLRMGEVVRLSLLSKRFKTSASVVLVSIMLERLLDIFTLLALALCLAFVMEIPPVVQISMATFACVCLIMLLSLIFLARHGNRLSGLISRVAKFKVLTLVPRLIKGLAEGLNTLKNRRQLGKALLLSVLAWLLAGICTIAFVSAFNLPTPWYAGFFVLVVINLGAAIPSSPGSIGVYHYLAVLALSVWLTDKSMAMGYAVGTHGVNILVNILLGCVCIAIESRRSMVSYVVNPQQKKIFSSGGVPDV